LDFLVLGRKMWEWLIFVLVFFLYVHIVHQYQSSEESDIYEYDYVDNTNLQETCNGLQPFVFLGRGVVAPLPDLEEAVRENSEVPWYMYECDDPRRDPVQIPAGVGRELVGGGLGGGLGGPAGAGVGRWYSEGNSEFLGEAEGFASELAEMDPFLKPAFTVAMDRDVGLGAVGAVTPLRYHTNTRRFLVVGGTGAAGLGAAGSGVAGSGGRISVKMTPWKKHRRYLHEVRDYDRGEYRSGVDLWCPGERHRRDAKKVEVLEFDVTSGYVLYIPPYWGYTIRYDVGGTWVAEYRYCTLFNRMAFLGELGRTWLQQRNTYTKVHRRWVGGSGGGGSVVGVGDGSIEKSSSSFSPDKTGDETGDKKEVQEAPVVTETSGGGDEVGTGGRDGGEAWGAGLD
jgi:hypothetical protein